jgi:hypothetical protein
MRRILASLLVTLFTIPLIVPVLIGDPSLPSCCRRDGNDHGAMSDPGSGDPALKAAAKCPMYPGIGSGVVSEFSTLPVEIGVAAAPAAFSAALSESARVAAEAFRGSNALKRGPPSVSC